MVLLVHKLINARKTCPDIYIQGSDAGLINFFMSKISYKYFLVLASFLINTTASYIFSFTSSLILKTILYL